MIRNIIELTLIIALINGIVSGHFNWVCWVLLVVAVAILATIVYDKICAYKSRVKIRRLVWYERQHVCEVTPLIDMPITSNFVKKVYYQELNKYDRLHGVDN